MRRALWFLVPFLLTIFAGLAFADTIPATPPASTYAATAGPNSETAVAAFQQGRSGTWLTIHATAVDACTAASTLYGSEQGWAGVTHAGFTNCDSTSCFCTLNATTPSLSNYWPGLNGPQERNVWAWPSDNTLANIRLSGSTAPTRSITVTYSCPSGGTLSGTTCTIEGACPSGYTLNSGGQTCSAPDCGDFQQRIGGTCTCSTESLHNWLGVAPYSLYEGPLSAFPSSLDKICMPTAPGSTSGCYVPARMANSLCTSSYCEMQVMHGASGLGTSCTAGTGTNVPELVNTDSPEHKCISQGMSFGTVNGSVVCVPKGSSPEPTKSPTTTTTTTNTNGSGTTIGTTTETKATECVNGACTTTTVVTVRDSTGTVTGTTTTTSSGSGNGTGDGEGDESGFGGTCSAGFSCDGDAIQCAIAREQHVRNCQFWTDQSVGLSQAEATTEVGKAVTEGKKDPSTWVPTKSIEVPSLTGGERINAGACPADASIASPLGTIVLPLAWACPYLEALGYVILFTSLMVAGRIFLGAF